MAGIVSAANVGGVVDPRLGGEADAIGTTREGRGSISGLVAPPDLHGRHGVYNDHSILFENYHYWANRSREVEKHIQVGDVGFAGLINLCLGRRKQVDVAQLQNDSDENSQRMSEEKNKVADEKLVTEKLRTASGNHDRYGITETEWEHAQRATRTATWGSIFYLITTDILGPSNVPYAISTMGYGPGVALYAVFGAMAAYSGLQLWKIFVGLDSTRYPLRNYGDVAFRLFGQTVRVGVNALQSFQFFLNVALIIVTNGQGLAQMAVGVNQTGYIPFVVAELVCALMGFTFGQIRTLQRLSWLANIAIWLNVIVIIETMVVVHVYPPNYAAAASLSDVLPNQPIQTYASWPPGSGLVTGINGLMNCVFAYGGATLFNELMAEMRRPMDFWKGFVIAEVFIFLCYMISGLVTYSAQGQYTYNPAYQGIPANTYAQYSWQTLGNALSLISGAIAGILYGNIGIKILYASVFRDIFSFPPLDSKKGKWIWVAFVPIYWACAFLLAAGVPQVNNLTAFVGAACILQFSYTFPPAFKVAYNVQRDAMLPSETFDPITGVVTRVDSGPRRWWRGYKKHLLVNTFDVLYSLAALATAGLGIYTSVIGMHEAFDSQRITPFSTKNPAGQ